VPGTKCLAACAVLTVLYTCHRCVCPCVVGNETPLGNMSQAHTTSTYPHCNGCEVEQGFYEGHEALKAQVVPAVHYLKNLHPDLPLYVTGHSLGAALAVLSAAHIQSQEGVDVNQLYTFGLPRVGNQAFSTWFKQQIPQAIHVTHYDDVRALCKSTLTRNPNSLVDAMLDALTQIVPHVPPENFGYHHTATEVCAVYESAFVLCCLIPDCAHPPQVWYDVESGLNYKVCDGSGEDPSCADGVHFWDFSIDDHLVYLGVHICSCTPISWPPSGYTGDAALRGSR